jgi:uncharacterized protein YjbJ (UPF0337 family)
MDVEQSTAGSGRQPTSNGGRNPTGGPAAATKDSAKESARDVASTAAGSASEVAGEARVQTRRLAHDAMGQAQGLMHEARGQAMERAGEQADRAAVRLRAWSTQLRALAEGRPEEAGPLADLARSATDQMSSFSQRLDSGGVEGLMSDVRRYARRRPGMFLLACAGAGFVAGRIAKAERASTGQGEETGYAGYPGYAYQSTSPLSAGTPIGGAETMPAVTGVTYGDDVTPVLDVTTGSALGAMEDRAAMREAEQRARGGI